MRFKTNKQPIRLFSTASLQFNIRTMQLPITPAHVNADSDNNSNAKLDNV